MADERVPLLKRVDIKNFKCIHDLQLELSPLTVLIGKNDTGKTSILEAISVLSGACPNDPRLETSKDGKTSFVRNGRAPAEVLLKAHFSDGSVKPYPLDGGRNSGTDSRLRNVRSAYRLEVNELRSPAHIGALKMLPLPFDGSSFAEAVDRIPFTLQVKIQADYSSRLTNILEFRCDSIAKLRGHKQVFFDVRGEGLVSADLISDGALLILAYLVIANDEHRPPLIMIEEPENGIHPRQLQGVMELFKSLTTGENPVQVIMTTHSPFVLDCVPPESVRVCTRDDKNGVQVHKFSEEEPIRSLLAEGFTLGEAWFNVDEDLIGKSTK